MKSEPELEAKSISKSLDELDQLRADNARLKSEVERWKEGAIRDNDEFQRTLADLQSHKAALEKARVAIETLRDCVYWKSRLQLPQSVYSALATINELLQKGSVKS